MDARALEDLPSKLVNAGDALNAAMFASLAPMAWGLPESKWSAIAHICARLHLAARGSAAGDLVGRPALAQLGLTPSMLEREVLAGNYLETMQMLREHRPGGWKPALSLHGRSHIEEALKDGRGVVLWVASCNFAEMNTKKALHAAGLSVTNLRSYAHPYSDTRLGRAWLNRLRTSVEDRYLAGTVTLLPRNAAWALRQLQLRLRENAIVSITASSAGDEPFKLPFLGGTLSLALGAPTLALAGRAPLLPVFTSASNGSYRVHVEPPLRGEEATAGRTAAQRLACAFAGRLEAFVTTWPTSWRGWFNRYQWRP